MLRMIGEGRGGGVMEQYTMGDMYCKKRGEKIDQKRQRGFG